MQDELNRPLGLDRRKKKPPSRLAILAGLAGVCFLAGAGAYVLTGQFGAAPPEPIETAAANQTETPKLPVPAEQPSGEITGSTPPDTDGQTEPLAAVEPDGAIAPLVPVPEIRRQELALAHLPDPALAERGATGVIPQRSKDGQRPMDVYSRPPATEGNFGVARVVLIVGGLGISQSSSQQAIRDLPGAVTLAFAPYGNSLGRWMQEARKRGHELLLQIPMEPFGYPANNPGPHTLKSQVSAEENLADLHWAMSRITNYVGVMNFMGGKLVTTPPSLEPIFAELASRGLLYVDDGSVKNSQAEPVARAAALPFTRAGIIIDADRSRRSIAENLEKLVSEARRTGLAIGVASAFPDSIEMIAKFANHAEGLEIEITPVSAIVSDPERGRQ